MKHRRLLSLFLSVLLCFSAMPLAFASTATGAEASPLAAEAVDYDALYVQDGLTFKWDAFDKKAGDEPPEALGNSLSTGVESVAILSSKATYGDGYLLYRSTNDASLLDFGGLMPGAEDTNKGDVTFDVSLAQNPTLTWSADSPVATNWTSDQDNTNQFAMFTSWRLFVNSTTASGKTYKPYDESYGFFCKSDMNTPDASVATVDGSSTWRNTDSAAYTTWWGVGNWRVFGNYLGEAFYLGYVLDYDVGGTEERYEFTILRDGQIATGLSEGTKGSKTTAVITGTYKTVNQACKFGSGAGFAYYSIRFYNRALSDIELQQNHFADLAKYFKADLTGFTALEPHEKADLYAACADIQYTTSNGKAELEAEVKQMTMAKAYAALYVQDGLTFKWDAFDLKAGASVSALKNSLTTGVESVAITSTSAKAYDGYLLYTGVLSLDSLMPGAADANKGDVTFDVSLAQNPTLTWSADSPVANFTDVHVNTNKFAMFSNWNLQVNSTSTTGQTYKPYDESYGFVYKSDMNTPNSSVATVDPIGDKTTWRNTDSANPNQWGFGNWRVFGNYLGKAFSISYVVDYDVNDEADKYEFKILRDGQIATGLSSGNSGSKTTAVITGTYKTVNQACQFGSGAGFAYYSIRFYNRALSETELQQNHFADLVNYFNADITGLESIADRTALYQEVAALQYTDDNAAATLDMAILKAKAAAGDAEAALEIKLREATAAVIKFDGFAVRVNAASYAGLRSVYTIDTAATLDGLTLVEVGAIMAVAETDRTMADLAVSKGTDGYGIDGNRIKSGWVYRNGALREGHTFNEGKNFAFTTIYDSFDTITEKEAYETELMYRAYVIFSDGTNEYVRYIDAVGDTVATDGIVSMLTLSKHEKFADYETSKRVVAACEASN